MREVIAEFLLILAYSAKTQIALALGIVAFVGLQLLGVLLVGDFAFHGVLAPMTDTVRGMLLDKYEKLAWLALGTSLWVAVKLYRRDRNRLFNS